MNICNKILLKTYNMGMALFSRLIGSVDVLVEKEKDIWVFPVYFIGEGRFCDNNLAIFETVKNDHCIKKVILTKEVKVYPDGKNVVVIPMRSLSACYYLLRAKVLFVQHSVWLDFSRALYQIRNFDKRIVVNLWHGIPIKDISHHNTGIISERSKLEMPAYRVITSSETDQKNMQKAFYLAKPDNFWITGLPRNDFLVKQVLPLQYQQEVSEIKKIKGDKILILYAPTYREIQSGGENYNFSDEEIVMLNNFLHDNNCILGVRYHLYRQPKSLANLLSSPNVINMEENLVSDIRMAIRQSDIVITDYSSIFVDASYIDKPCIRFAYDYEHYMNSQRGFFYQFDEIFPGPICQTFETLISEMQKSLNGNLDKRHELIKKTFFRFLDENNSKRVVEKLKSELGFH